MKPTVTRKDDGTIVIKLHIPADVVNKAKEEITLELVKHVSLPGFRKGKVPAQMAREKLSKELVQEETLKKVVPEAYNSVVKAEGLTPIVSPRLHIESFDEEKGVTLEAETAEAPKVTLGKYKDAVKDVTAKSKIIVPGKEEKDQKPNLDQILASALKEVKVTIPKVIIDQEANRLLSQMLDELKSLGLTLEQFLASRNKTGEEVRKDYEDKAEQDLKLEFFLREVADVEKITVEPQDIEEALNGITDPKQREEVSRNPYFVANIIRQQKTLNFLTTI